LNEHIHINIPAQKSRISRNQEFLGTEQQGNREQSLLVDIFTFLVEKISRIYSNFEAISKNLPQYKNKTLKKLMILSDNKAFKNFHAKLLPFL
jgi:hypothetical protein